MKRALVLSGGGAKGAYQIGVYKALKRLNIKIDIITGTSIGSINGASLVAGEYKKIKKFWLKTETSEIFNYDFNKIENLPKIAKEMIINKGLKFDKAEDTLEKVINERKIRKSKIDYGLVTVNLKTRVPKMLTKDEIPEGKLLSYVIASSTCFPAVETKEIDGEHYIDGGYYDNLPINLAIEMGADEVIAIDLASIGIKSKKIDKDIKIDYIKTSNKRLFSINFDPQNSKESMLMGYNDTMKYFGKLGGKTYTFKKNHLDKNYETISETYEKLLKKFLISDKESISLTGIIKNRRYKKILLNIKNGKSLKDEVNDSIEYLGSLFGIEKSKTYSIKKFNKILIKNVKELNYISIDKNLKGKMLLGYIFNKYIKDPENEDMHKKLLNVALVFPKDFLAAIYLIVISNQYPLNLKSDKFYNDILDTIKK